MSDPIDSSPPGSPVPGILQARTLEWVAISSSNAWKWRVKVKSLQSESEVRLLATPWTAAYQAPASMGFSRQEYWSGVPLTSPLNCLHSDKKKNLDLGHLVIYFSISNVICSRIYFILLTQHFILIHQIPVCLLNAWSQGQPENQEEFVGRIWGSLLLQFSFRFPPDILGAVLTYKLVCCFIWL